MYFQYKLKVLNVMKQFFLTITMILTFSLNLLLVYAGKSDERKLNVYPNPIERNTVLTIDMPTGEYEEITLYLYNTVGKVIHITKTTDKKVEIKAPDISGIYLLRIVEKQRVIAVEKIVVKE